MVGSIYSNLSALNALGRKMGVIGNNVANVETEGFKRSRTVLAEGDHGQVEAQVQAVETPGPLNPEAGLHPDEPLELSNVELAREIPQTITTQRGYEANLKAVTVQDEMLGSVLDILE